MVSQFDTLLNTVVDTDDTADCLVAFSELFGISLVGLAVMLILRIVAETAGFTLPWYGNILAITLGTLGLIALAGPSALDGVDQWTGLAFVISGGAGLFIIGSAAAVPTMYVLLKVSSFTTVSSVGIIQVTAIGAIASTLTAAAFSKFGLERVAHSNLIETNGDV